MVLQLRPWEALNKVGTHEPGDKQSKTCGI